MICFSKYTMEHIDGLLNPCPLLADQRYSLVTCFSTCHLVEILLVTSRCAPFTLRVVH